ncbi:Sodium-dependent nutrient amino acid transporter 1, partial [Orchesella cincta]
LKNKRLAMADDDNRNDLNLKYYPKIVNIELGIINTGYSVDENDVYYYKDDKEAEVKRNEELEKSQNGSQNEKSNAADEKDTKQTWDNQLEFLLSCIAMSVGLGNVWRFPFTVLFNHFNPKFRIAFENGGGAFLVPYIVSLVIVGRPMYYLEMCIGQFSRLVFNKRGFQHRGPVKVWEVVPFFRGIGYTSMIAVLCTVSFYCSIMAVTVYYFFASFLTPLPWSETICENNSTIPNSTLVSLLSENGPDVCELHEQSNTSISELYYFHKVFPQLEDINNGIGVPHWKLALCLLLAWVIIYLCIVKGIQSAGKVAYFTAIFPYVVLICLLIRGLTLPGSLNGIYYFIRPQWDKILSPKVWFAAVSQCFFSLTVGFGTITFLSSHNKFRHNVYRDAIIISITDTLTSLLAGCTIFSILGYLADSMGVEVSEVTKGGPGLAFIAFPDALAKLTWFPQGFAVIFFLMLFVLGIGSAVSLTGQLITIIREQYPSWKEWRVGLVMCLIGFCTGMVFITPGGQFILTLVNHNGADFIIYITAMLEIIAVSWVYGVNNFCKDLKFMLGRETELYWKVCWAFIMPVFLLSLLVYYFVQYDWLTHEGVQFPTSAVVCGWILSGISLSCLPFCAIHAVSNSPGETWMEKLKASFKPSSSWGPKIPAERELWLKMKEEDDVDCLDKKQVDRMSIASTVTPKSDGVP